MYFKKCIDSLLIILGDNGGYICEYCLKFWQTYLQPHFYFSVLLFKVILMLSLFLSQPMKQWDASFASHSITWAFGTKSHQSFISSKLRSLFWHERHSATLHSTGISRHSIRPCWRSPQLIETAWRLDVLLGGLMRALHLQLENQLPS